MFAGWAIASAQQQPVMKNELVAASNRFGFNLLSQLTDAGYGENVFISPTSVAMCLSMVYNGASGRTQAGMAKALELSGMSPDMLSRTNASLMQDLLTADPKVKLQIANSLWAKKGIEFQKPFLAANQEHFKARVTALDFGSPEAAKTINAWVSQNTNGLIRSIVDRIDPLDILFLINAIYFKGTWTEQFDKDATYERDFHLLNGSTAKRMMMQQDGKYQYFAADGFQAVSLPYGSGRLSMYLFVPEKKDGLPDLLEQLNAANWEKWLSGFYRMSGEVVLPRFKLEYEASLNDALKAMGMADAFAPDRADFSKMVKPPIQAYISEVKHKTFVEVNEQGTEAAAVTSTRVAMTAMPSPHEKFSIVADRPFLCAISDNTTGAVLFMGAIYDPEQ
jgi:serpin B